MGGQGPDIAAFGRVGKLLPGLAAVLAAEQTHVGAGEHPLRVVPADQECAHLGVFGQTRGNVQPFTLAVGSPEQTALADVIALSGQAEINVGAVFCYGHDTPPAHSSIYCQMSVEHWSWLVYSDGPATPIGPRLPGITSTGVGISHSCPALVAPRTRPSRAS